MAKKQYEKELLPEDGPDLLPPLAPKVIAPGLKFDGKPKFWSGVLAEIEEVLATLGVPKDVRSAVALQVAGNPALSKQLFSLSERAKR